MNNFIYWISVGLMIFFVLRNSANSPRSNGLSTILGLLFAFVPYMNTIAVVINILHYNRK